ncbi:MAG: hypothetical protein J6S67_24045 [Methanobrevibacter sp.]|nr:hypothetical protein [Methanobrevibacter sp.]
MEANQVTLNLIKTMEQFNADSMSTDYNVEVDGKTYRVYIKIERVKDDDEF